MVKGMTRKMSKADLERNLWRFAANSPELPEAQRRFSKQMSAKLNGSSDAAVLQHVEYRENATKAYRKEPHKKRGMVPYFHISEPGIEGVFCPNELSSFSQSMYASLNDHDGGGRKSGYNLPDHLNHFEMTKYYVEQLELTGKQTEAARRVIIKFKYGRDENGAVPTNDVLNTRVRRFNRWRKNFLL